MDIKPSAADEKVTNEQQNGKKKPKVSLSKEEYQKHQKRSMTQPFDERKPQIKMIELESTQYNYNLIEDNNNNNNDDNDMANDNKSDYGMAIPNPKARLHSMSVDIFNDRLQENQKEKEKFHGHFAPGYNGFMLEKLIKLDGLESLVIGLDSLAMMTTMYKHKKAIYHGSAATGTNNNNNNKGSETSDMVKPLLLESVNNDEPDNNNNKRRDSIDLDASKCTFTETALNSVGYMMSIVILSVPYVLSTSGFSAMITLLVICILTFFSALMLDELLNYYNNITNYSELVEYLLGQKGKALCAILTFIELYLYVIAIFIFSGDLLYSIDTAFFENLQFLDTLTKKDCIIIMTLLLMPLCHLTNLKPLSRLSGIGLFGIIATYILVIFITILYQINNKASIHGFNEIIENFFTNPMEFGYGVGVLISIFCLHTLMPNLKTGMQNPKDFKKIIYIVWIMITPLSLVIGFCGYLTFDNNIEDSVTSNFTGVYSLIALFLLIIKAGSSSASCLFPVTLLIESTILKMSCISGKKNNTGNNNNNNKNNNNKNNNNMGNEFEKGVENDSLAKTALKFKEKIVKFWVPTILVLIALLIGISLQSFAFVCNLAGSICALAMTVIFPCTMYVMHLLKVEKNNNNVSGFGIGKIYLKIIVAVGVLIIMVSLALWNLVSLVYYGP